MHIVGLRGGNRRKCGLKRGLLCGHSNSGFCSLIKWPQKGALSLSLCVGVWGALWYGGLCQVCSILQWIGRQLQRLRSPLRAPFASLLTVGNLAQNTMSLTSGSQPLHIVQDTVVRDTVAPGVFSLFYPSVLKARHWKISLQAEAAHTLPLVCLFHGKAKREACVIARSSLSISSLWCLRFETDRAEACGNTF